MTLEAAEIEPKESAFQSFYKGPSLECIATDLDPNSFMYFRVRGEIGEHFSQWSLPLHVVMEDRRFPDLTASQFKGNVELPSTSREKATKATPLNPDLVGSSPQQPSTAVELPNLVHDSTLSTSDLLTRNVSHGLC